jgi:hypothetical protein
MIETPLRSMINNGIWKAMLIPVPSMNIIVDPKNIESYSLYFIIPSLSEIWSSISPYCVPSCYRQTSLLVLMTLYSRDLVTRLQASWMQLSPSGLRVSIRHADVQIPLLIHTPQHTSLKYMRYTYYITYLQSNHWCSQGILQKQWLEISRSKD